MRALKGFLFVITGFFVVITAISLLMPSTVIVNRTVTIATDSVSAITQVRDIKNWVEWHPYFADKEPSAGRLANGKEYLQWDRNGNKYQLYEVLKYPNGIRVALKRAGENDVINDVTVYRAGLQNQVEWRAINKIKWYPWEKFGALFIHDITAPGYEEALKSLKAHLERNSR